MSTSARLPLGWIGRDGRLIIASRGSRALGQGFLGVVLALYLRELGFSLARIGAFLSIGVAGSAVFSLLVGVAAERLGRRRLMVGFALLPAVAGVALASAGTFAALVPFAFLGGLSGTPGDVGPLRSMEQATLPDSAPARKRTDLFVVYGIVASGFTALGALAAGLPALLQGATEMGFIASYRPMFLAFAALHVLAAALYVFLSPEAGAPGRQRHWTNPLRLPSRRIIFTLTGLFSVDHFAGTLVMQSLLAYWFATRYGLDLGSLAVVFALSQVLAAVSLWLAARIAARIGLLNTMVFTHIPANLLLIALPFAPWAWLAVLLWQLRSFLGQMDVPTRESYTMAVVGPEERVAFAGMHLASRSVSGTLGPSVATALWNAVSASAPIIGCGLLKIGYDVALYLTFRSVRPPEEAPAVARAEAAAGDRG